VTLGTGLETVYLDQSRADLKPEMTLWDALTPSGGDSIIVRGHPKHVAAYAKDFLFRDGQLRQPVSSLSGGERNRLLLARALAQPANLLVLDEPTNDLDMETLDLLEDLLADYDGTLILVSHDRDFIDRLATSTIALDGRGRVVETPGGWTEFMRQNPGFFDARQDEARVAAQGRPPAAPPPAPRAKLSYKDQRRLEEAEREMAELPKLISSLETRLHDPGLYGKDPAAFARLTVDLDTVRARLESAETDWLEIEARRDALVSGG